MLRAGVACEVGVCPERVSAMGQMVHRSEAVSRWGGGHRELPPEPGLWY